MDSSNPTRILKPNPASELHHGPNHHPHIRQRYQWPENSEEEKRTATGGDSSVVRVVSNPDANGRLQLVQRDIEQTKKISKDVEETKTTTMLPGINGDLAPAMQVQERRERRANDSVESQETTSLPDGSGNWQVSETRHATTKQEGKNTSTEKRVSRLDSEGKLSEVSRTVSKEFEGASGEKSATTEVYSVDVPGSARDGSLHLVERANRCPTHDFNGSTNHSTSSRTAGSRQSQRRSASDHTDYRHRAPGLFRCTSCANHSSARPERHSHGSLGGHHKVRQDRCRPGSDRAP